MDRSRIPLTHANFIDFVKQTNAYLQAAVTPTHGERLGLSTSEVSKWNTKSISLINLYEKKNDPNTRTSPLVNQFKTDMKGFRNFAQPVINRIAASTNANDADAATFHITLHPKTRTIRSTMIKELCYAIIVMIGGCKAICKCRSILSGKRASLLPDCDMVEVAYIIGDKETKVPDADSIDKRMRFSKATFMLDLGTINAGKILYIYFRWTISTHPDLAGPWSKVYRVIIA